MILRFVIGWMIFWWRNTSANGVFCWRSGRDLKMDFVTWEALDMIYWMSSFLTKHVCSHKKIISHLLITIQYWSCMILNHMQLELKNSWYWQRSHSRLMQILVSQGLGMFCAMLCHGVLVRLHYFLHCCCLFHCLNVSHETKPNIWQDTSPSMHHSDIPQCTIL